MTPALPLALAALATLAAPDAGPDAGPRTELSTITGTVSEVAFAERRFTVETEQGATTLTFDRNTAFYLPRRMGTIRDLAPGEPVRAAHGADGRAYWVEIRTGEEAIPSAAAPLVQPEPTVVAPPAPRGGSVGRAAAPPDAGAPRPEPR